MNSILQITEHGFEDIKEMIREDSAFKKNPNVTEQHADNFLLIITVGNLEFLDDHFEVDEAAEIRKLIIEKFANIYGVTYREFEDWLSQTRSFISSVNHPSKNMLYGMSKAIFHKFGLNDYQEDYFRTLKTPNPLFLKRMDDIMSNFLWDWDQFFKKHKFHLN
ncbi:MAG: hypothetical protein HUJ25_16105 [Crocinitomicaceae bacterium]|nr:hypothetical protein [Crocinitomicaceae bacterium]